jgi:poly-gamma-glutamate synthesis protein (capsule biosynthesis protein)
VRRPSTPAFLRLLAFAVVPLLALAVIGGAPATTPSSGTPTLGATSPLVLPVGAVWPAVLSPAVLSPAVLSPASSARGALADVPIVPVVDFRATATSIGIADVRAVLASTDRRWHAVELVVADADGILAALGLDPPSDPGRLVLAPSAAALARDLAREPDRLAFVRASQVTPAVRAIAWDGRSLFGVDRVPATTAWGLTAHLAGDARPFDPGATWTLVAGGDILLDRGVYKQTELLGKGADFPFDGGTATITGRRCCSSFDWPVPIARRTGNAGAVRHLLSSADIAVANFENPAPNDYRYHTKGTVFSADRRLIAGLKNAGIDVVSIANNHIGDAGRAGVVQTVANLEAHGIEHAGAGRNTAAAHAPAMLSAGGLRVAILGYDTIAKYYAAGPTTAGSAQLTVAGVKADVAAARAAGADVVIVYPHWGIEYTATPFPAQRALAHAVIDAGADMVIGNHVHWVGAMEVYKGHPIWYALGNFVFDQVWSEPTQEGLILELTFNGPTLVQVRLHPTLILDQAQPNLLDPAGSGRVVLDRLYDASKKLLPW